MAKKVKRFADGDIVVSGSRPGSNGLNSLGGYTLPMQDIRKSLTKPDDKGIGSGGRSSTPSSLPVPASSRGPVISPAVIRQPSSTLGQLSGTTAPKGYGVSLKGRFKKGGKVKKMAAGGSASKRADGCATKGKTKGRFV
jgi:hypothetical protein